MQKTKRQILSTVILGKKLIDEALLNDILIDEISFINTKEIEDESVINNISTYLQQKIIVVFTSMNAVTAVAKFSKQKPEWKIYCISSTTRKLVVKSFGKNSVAGTADSAQQLAEVIVADKIKEVVFFCGDKRRDELPDKLKENNISVKEIIVYSTIKTPVSVKKYDGVLFFSPSDVDSYFSVNKLDEATQLFAIGSTTAKAIQQYNKNNIIISPSPAKENLVREMIANFTAIKKDQTVL